MVEFLLLHRKELVVGRELLVSVLLGSWVLTRMSLMSVLLGIVLYLEQSFIQLMVKCNKSMNHGLCLPA